MAAEEDPSGAAEGAAGSADEWEGKAEKVEEDSASPCAVPGAPGAPKIAANPSCWDA